VSTETLENEYFGLGLSSLGSYSNHQMVFRIRIEIY